MSLSSVTRRRSRRKLQHQAKNLDDVLFPPTNSSYSIKTDKSEESGRRHTHHHHHHHHHHRKRNDDFACPHSRSKSLGHPKKSSDSLASSHSVSSYTITGSKSSSSNGLFERSAMNTLALSDLELGSLSFRIGQVTYQMDEQGYWSSSSDICKNLNEATAKLREQNKTTAQENNMLRVKNELLASMIAKKTIRKEKIETELDRLRKLLSCSSSRFSVNSVATADRK